MKYDTTFKDLLWRGAPALIEQLTGSPPVKNLLTSFPATRHRYPDFLAWLLDGRLLHLELQNDPDDRMDYRMLDYYGPVSEQNGGVEVYQVVLAVTDASAAAMRREIRHGNLQFRFAVISWQQLDAAPLLASAHPDDTVLAILCRTDDMRQRVKAILARLRSLDENERNDAVARLIILAGLRKAEPIVVEEVHAMAIRIDVERNAYLKDLFLKAKAEGMAETLLRLLGRRFGSSVAEASRQRVAAASQAQLDAWIDAIMDAESPDAIFDRTARH